MNLFKLNIILFTVLVFISSCGQNTESKNLKKSEAVKNDPIEQKKMEQKIELASLDKPYNPSADAKADIENLVKIAQKENKHIILQAGGNWCIWCLRFEKFRKQNPTIKQIIDDNYLYYHLNYSEENKNEEILNYYGNPGSLGYPSFVILDKNGIRLFIQGSESLEDGDKGYDEQAVIKFLEKWKP